jgi:hypothetical protein
MTLKMSHMPRSSTFRKRLKKSVFYCELFLFLIREFSCPILNVMGDHSPHDDDVVETNGRLDPTNSSFVKFADCGGMVLEEQPGKMAEAMRHFLQGLGYGKFPFPCFSLSFFCLETNEHVFVLLSASFEHCSSLDFEPSQ